VETYKSNSGKAGRESSTLPSARRAKATANRLFNHYYYRAIAESHHKGVTKANGESLFLDETGRQWLKQYAPGKLRAKRIELYAKMEGARTL
jgi:hypothetical protein